MSDIPQGDPRLVGPFLPAPGEYFIDCPYDANHRLLNHRFWVHVANCRKMYYTMCAQTSQEPLTFVCPYNSYHTLPLIERELHEENCEDKEQFLRKEKAQKDKGFYASMEGGSEYDKLVKVVARALPPQTHEPPAPTNAALSGEDSHNRTADGPAPTLRPLPRFYYAPRGLTTSEKKTFIQIMRASYDNFLATKKSLLTSFLPSPQILHQSFPSPDILVGDKPLSDLADLEEASFYDYS